MPTQNQVSQVLQSLGQQIEIPFGFQLVGFGVPKCGQWYLHSVRGKTEATKAIRDFRYSLCLMVEKVNCPSGWKFTGVYGVPLQGQWFLDSAGIAVECTGSMCTNRYIVKRQGTPVVVPVGFEPTGEYRPACSGEFYLRFGGVEQCVLRTIDEYVILRKTQGNWLLIDGKVVACNS